MDLLAIGLAWGLAVFNDTYGYYGIVADPGAVPLAELAVALGGNVLWVPGVGLIGTFLILLFPDGRLPSPRWKPLACLSAIALTLSSLVILLMPGALAQGDPSWEGLPPIPNPLGMQSLRPILENMLLVIVLIPICFVGCAESLIQRFRRARGVERVQLRWLTSAAAAMAAISLIVILFSLPVMWGERSEPAWLQFMNQVSFLSFALIPVAAGIAILKHRLFDIDLVIKKTLVSGALAAFITVVYVDIVVGMGNLLGASDEPDPGLSVLATAVVAVAFQPVRERLEHVANRLVYGRRATPYEVLSEFSDRMAETYATEDVLPAWPAPSRKGSAPNGPWCG